MIEIEMFASGTTMAFKDGKQVSEAQEPWVIVYANYLRDRGIDPTQCTIKLPNGRYAEIFEIEGYEDAPPPYNWEIIVRP